MKGITNHLGFVNFLTEHEEINLKRSIVKAKIIGALEQSTKISISDSIYQREFL